MRTPIIILGGLFDGRGMPWSTHVAADVRQIGGEVITPTGLLGRLANNWRAGDWRQVARAMGEKLHRPFIVGGHSDGALVALELAANSPHCAGLAYCSGMPRPLPPRRDWSQVTVLCSCVWGELTKLIEGTMSVHRLFRATDADVMDLVTCPRPRRRCPHLLGLGPHLFALRDLIARVAVKLASRTFDPECFRYRSLSQKGSP